MQCAVSKCQNPSPSSSPLSQGERRKIADAGDRGGRHHPPLSNVVLFARRDFSKPAGDDAPRDDSTVTLPETIAIVRDTRVLPS